MMQVQRYFSVSQLRCCARLYSSQAATKGKSQLAVLRKRTGFPIGKCREALTKHNEDMDAAESWLYSEAQKEGWSKVEKLKDRMAHQGLIGMLLRGNQAVMVEVNCETDFVARNDKFKALISTVTRATFEHKVPKLLEGTTMPSLDYLTKDLIGAIPTLSQQTLADTVAETVGHLSENIKISRGCSMGATGGLLCGFVYNSVSPPDSEVQLGTYGTLLHMLPVTESPSVASSDLSNSESLRKLGQQVCQHVVGMDVDNVTSEGEAKKDLIKELDEQSFLFNNEITVGELLAKNRVTITKVVRYALGQTDKCF